VDEADPQQPTLAEGLRVHWWAAVAAVTRIIGGDLGTAEDAVQEACLAALARWPVEGVPVDPRGWLVGTARHKALDQVRREARRVGKESAAAREMDLPSGPVPETALPAAEDQLGLMFMCCHPALDPPTQVALTLRAVCGLSPAQIARVFLLPEATMAKRLVRARRKIRDTGIPLTLPAPEAIAVRLASVLRVIQLVFTEGHKPGTGDVLVRPELCAIATETTRTLYALLPSEPEVAGLLALLLLTDARRAARLDRDGELVLLAEQDRSRYDQTMICEGEALLEQALRVRRAGPFLIQAAIAACHSTAATATDTDWREIAALYGELLRYEPSPVHEAHRAVAVAMAEGPAAGLVILDAVAHHPQLARWPGLHLARADLLARLHRCDDAVEAYRTALQLDPTAPERRFIHRRLDTLTR